MNKTVYLRIGSDKAGTVTIADFVENNRDLLNSFGLIAPLRNCIGFIDYIINKYKLESINKFSIENILLKNSNYQEELNDFFELDFITNNKNIFLTTETLWGRLSRVDLTQALLKEQTYSLLRHIKEYFNEYQFKIILHIRRGDLYIESLYGQHVKSGGKHNLHKFMSLPQFEKIPVNSLILIKIFEDTFGKDNIIIKPFERSQMKNKDLLDDLLEILSLYNYRQQFIRTLGNESLHRILIDILPEMNKVYGKILTNKELIEISNFLKNELKLPTSKVLLSTEDRVKINNKFEAFYNYISKNFFNKEKIFIESMQENTSSDFFISNETYEITKKMLLQCSKREIGSEYLSQFKEEYKECKN